MWRKLFRAKWRHRNRDIRAEAVQLLPADDPNLVEVVRQDADTGIRRQVLRRITDITLLLDIAENDSDSSVSRAAGRRLWYLLAQSEDAASVQQTREVLKEHGDSEMAEYMIRHSKSSEVRLQALEEIQRPALLSEVALTDANTNIRLQALERISRLSTLKRIAKEARGKNKRVARRARDLVEEHTLLQERPHLQQKLCDQIEHLASLQQPDQTALHQLIQQWEKVDADAPCELKTRFSNAQMQISKSIEKSRNNKAQLDHQRELCEQSDALLHDLEQNANAPSLNLNEIEAAEWMLRNSWRQLEEDLDAVNPLLKRRFNESQQRLAQRRGQIDQYRQQHAQQHAIIAEMQNLAASDAQLTASRVRAIEFRWQAQRSKPDADMEKHFRQYYSQAKQRLKANIDSAAKLEAELDQHLQQLENALDQGQLNAAGVARSKANHLLKRMDKLATAQLRQHKASYHRLLGRFSELQDWQRFGSDHVREDLINEMQQLIQSGLPARELAKSVRDLRNKWRQLDRKGGSAPEAIWNKFNEIAGQAYTPVIADQQRHQQQQQQAAQQRIEFCDLLAKEHALIDWSSPDWAVIDKRIQEARKQWRKLDGVDSRAWKTLNQRFINTVKPFEKQLRKVRESEKLRRERLIKRVQQLAQEPDIDTAIQQTKAAQASWRPLVGANKQVEQQLWKQFKTATDVVFARRTAMHENEQQEQQANTSAKTAICEKLQQLIVTEHENWSGARNERDQLVDEWKTIGPVTRQQYKSLQQKFNQLTRAFDEAETAASIRQTRDRFELLLQKSELCDRMEQQLCNQDADVGTLHKQWSAMPALQAAIESRMQRRYQHIIDALRSEGDAIEQLCAQRSVNLHNSLQLCLEMEVLLDIDSPEAFHEQRRQWQLTHLSTAMTGGLAQNESSYENVRQLLEESCVNGPLPQEGVDTIRHRERNIVAAMLER
jgi:mRNA-degrading endonuclease YafQ of YafQ-DinJ toxin-antitoxin module